jgi:hypothetical protein
MSKHQTTKSVFRFVCLLLLVCQALADDPVKVTETFVTHESTVAKEKHFVLELSESQITDIESKEKSIYITVEALDGDGIWTISGRDPREEENQGVMKKIEGSFAHKTPEIVGISTESEIWEEAKKGQKIYLTVKNTGHEEFPIKLNYVAELTPHLDIAAGAHHKIHTKSLTTLSIRTKITKAEGNHHYKFMLDVLQHGNAPQFSAEIYKIASSGLKSTTNKFLKFEQDRIGFVVSPEDTDLYCQETSCDYVITVSLKEVRSLDFYIGEHIDFELLSEGQTTVSYFDQDWLH